MAKDQVDGRNMEGARSVIIHGPQTTKFCNNEISTSKYSAITFLPKFLYEQFRRYANQIPNVSPTGRFTTAIPLVIILCVSAIKEIIEDIKRHKADDKTNNTKTMVLRPNSDWEEVAWKDVQVGEVVKISNGQGIPADIVIFSSSEPLGMCYIETSNLDGETNLKIRQGLENTYNMITIGDLSRCGGSIECEPANRTLDQFAGVLKLSNQGGRDLALNPAQLLLRGSSLRNTKWVAGVVVYSGRQTKVMLNSSAAPLKQSRVDKTTNTYILFLFGLLLFLALFTAIANIVWTQQYKLGIWYLGMENPTLSVLQYILDFITCIILYNTIIPISLPVQLEVVRFIQALFINWDKDMMDPETGTPAMARTSNLNEELGQIKYIFSDKTGTLTQNVMEFKACSVAGVSYGNEEENAIDNLALKRALAEAGGPEDLFFRILAVCHTVVPEYDEDAKEILFQASSPDEAAIVKGAHATGYQFFEREPSKVKIRVAGQEYSYQILHVIEFTSTRKRMSVIVRSPSGETHLYTKGADSIIYDRLSSRSNYRKPTLDHLDEFARIGLRTLCIAYRVVPEDFYKTWSEEFHEASCALENREDRIAAVAEKIECELDLVGATAIEDKLQKDVPETIAKLAEAGIKIWVLTGDKQETAINIGYSCRLLCEDMELMLLNSQELGEVQSKLHEGLRVLMNHTANEENNTALIIDGKTLELALTDACRNDFISVGRECKAVICCRVSPWQKAEIVRLIRSADPNTITLAIGDGANDVGMIQAAHVGIGINGKEGTQAACSSDYAIAQFRFLQKLLLVHGTWNYSRLTKLIFYSFYKNVCLYLIQFWFAMLSGFSGQIVFERWSIALYNVLFTCAPPFALGLFDRNIRMETCIKYPALYKETLEAAHFNLKAFVGWIGNSIFHSALLFWLPVYAFNHDIVYANGQTSSLLVVGNCVYTYVVIVVCIKAGLEHTAWTWLSHLAIWGSIGAWFLFLLVYSHFYPTFSFIASEMVGMDAAVFGCPTFWFGLFLVPTLALTRDVVWKILKRSMFQNLREQVLMEEAKARSGFTISALLSQRGPGIT
ncbi:Phospholipid-transporting ATPase IA [Cichlidogyrus casuarinus]|uniref:Phospholipid-transporting ATPase n=1 Tax=Cichlidogyrus casuarinus TaxID=1844966 RepID=A0ABD2Q9Z7_9PLAT